MNVAQGCEKRLYMHVGRLMKVATVQITRVFITSGGTDYWCSLTCTFWATHEYTW